MRIPLLLCLLLGLSACFGGGGPVPQDHYYHLAEVPAELASVNSPLGVIAVQTLRSDSLNQGRSVLYSLESAPLMLNTYYYHLWTNPPGKLIQEYLVTYLRTVGFARDIVRYGDRSQIDGEVSGYIQRFERIIGSGRPRVVVWLELTYRSHSPARPFRLTRVYKIERSADDDSMQSTVAAFSQALASICAQFVHDVSRDFQAHKS